MKKVSAYITTVLIACIAASCSKTAEQKAKTDTTKNTAKTLQNYRHNIAPTLAYTMAASYVQSLDSPTVGTRALAFDADEVRAYLCDTNIKQLQVILVHQQDWAENHYGERNEKKISVVLAGLDQSNAVITNQTGNLMDYADMCPSHCSTSYQ